LSHCVGREGKVLLWRRGVVLLSLREGKKEKIGRGKESVFRGAKDEVGMWGERKWADGSPIFVKRRSAGKKEGDLAEADRKEMEVK